MSRKSILVLKTGEALPSVKAEHGDFEEWIARGQMSRIIVDHEEIKDYMAAMEMSYLVSSAVLLRGLNPGDKIRFIIDADRRAIVDIGSTAK